MGTISHPLTVVLLSVAAALPATTFAFEQAPMLAKLVQEKKLEPVDQRLPEKPDVVKPVNRSGDYGGKLRSAIRGNADHNAILRMVGNQGLVRWTLDFNGVQPNVAESWTLSPDATEYVFKLRRGMKWSDGSPFTADDILFSMNDMVGNKQFYSLPPEAFLVKDKLPEVTKLDDYTVRFKFSGAYVGFVDALAQPIGQHPVLWQKRYCSQFHPKYNPKVEDLMAQLKVKDWAALMRSKCGDTELPTRWGNPERPSLDPWVIKQPYGGGATQVVLERNPYFWQVDDKGKQLPYIDEVQLLVISEVETIVLAAINGQLDFQHRHVFPIQNRPLLADNAAKGNYKLMTLQSLNANSVGLWINQSTKKEKLRKLVRNKEFRIALSHGVDRNEINQIVYLGQGTPWQTGPFKESRWYTEGMGTQYLEYDVAKANAILDKLGLTKRDSDGYRTYPDGGRVSIDTIVAIQLVQQIEVLELIRKQWQKIGVDLVIQATERSLNFDRANNNEYDMSVDVSPGGMDATQNPRAFVTVHPEARQSVQWYQWYLSNGKQGDEPSPSMKKRIQLFEEWRAAKTPGEAEAKFKELLRLAADEFEVIGIVRPPRDSAIRKTNLLNVYEQMPAGWSYPTPGPSLPQQWFYAKR